ncbi:hypothetical protein POSPLADRAFT_1181426 [Postia placenta MAD-698-R-SB12]|uniref:PHP domain-like protein n=1 Tax=Postia placenta MAD-698-R-SB12 TaxID=670580 RepID=A0A1X6N105_9APHY|nr:hypothetical protein POSPLADRAFT_1181426 [Postia placenta MAD-698-R-SB12]OSX62311.1 hypothetical protein POSPLADRAFT_1181426 [Postia placenta MAD-698-R-SB12]
MFIDLNVPVPTVVPRHTQGQPQSKKSKGKQQSAPDSVAFTPAQISAIESRIDLLVHLGYTTFALNQIVQRKVDAKTHINVLDPLLAQLRRRTNVVILKRITIVLDEESEKGFGLTTQNAPLFEQYDIIALLPTTQTTFSQACLSHSAPSPLTTHIIALPLALPRLPFHLKHTLVRTALRNGAAFEICYAGALGAEGDPCGSGGEGGGAAKRNWWAGAREVVRVTKGAGVLVSGGVVNDADLRSPRDVGNLLTILGLAQNVAHDANSSVPRTQIIRAQTRRTYRAVLSEPKVIIPENMITSQPTLLPLPDSEPTSALLPTVPSSAAQADAPTSEPEAPQNGKKRRLNGGEDEDTQPQGAATEGKEDSTMRKRKKKKTRENVTG